MKKKIKLLVVTPYFYPKIGGVEKHTYNLYKGLNEKFNYEIVVVTSNHEGKILKEEKINGMKIYRLPPQFKISNTPISFKWKNQIKEIIKKEEPSLIMAHSPVPFISDIAIMGAKIPSVLKYHSGSMKKGRFLIDLIISSYEKVFLPQVIKKADKLICTSDFVKKSFLKKFSQKSVTITPSVDIKKFKPKRSGSKKTSSNILFVGRIDKTSRWKGISYLLEAIKNISKKHSHIMLTIVGSGDDVEYYKKYVSSLKIERNVKFKGALDGDNLIKEYQNCDVFVLPSISEAESFGMVLIEAMACGKPVIGSDIGGIPLVINNKKDGFLVEPGDIKSLEEKIMKILNNPILAKRMGKLGRKKALDAFSLSSQVDKTNNIILEVLG